MEIRALTFFVALPPHPDGAAMAAVLGPLGEQAARVRERFGEAGLPIQSLRLATQPLEQLLPEGASPAELAGFAATYGQTAGEAGFRHLALGTLGATAPLAESGRQLLAALPAVIGATDWVFTSLQLATSERGLDADLIDPAARVVVETAPRKGDGFGNLRYCMVANMPPFSPFFPAAWHDGASAPAFAIAMEAADLVVQTAAAAADPWRVEAELAARFTDLGQRLDGIALPAARETALDYRGIDMSPSPYPAVPRSLGHAVERITGGAFGSPGSVAAVALIKRALGKAEFRKAGYCGVMLLPLEDATLAERAREGRYGIDSLLACAAVGATGLDVIPLPGDIEQGTVAALMRDVATLAMRLDEPLTVRLLPVPGLAAGQVTEFSFDYFAPTTAFTL